MPALASPDAAVFYEQITLGPASLGGHKQVVGDSVESSLNAPLPRRLSSQRLNEKPRGSQAGTRSESPWDLPVVASALLRLGSQHMLLYIWYCTNTILLQLYL